MTKRLIYNGNIFGMCIISMLFCNRLGKDGQE